MKLKKKQLKIKKTKKAIKRIKIKFGIKNK
jgi:hypothetical protein